MKIRALGEFCAEGSDGREIALGGAKPRTVLAMLCRDVGGLVTADELTMALWGEDAPPRARRSLSTFVSGLRRQMGDVIESRHGGYALSMDRSAVDVSAFEDAVSESRYEDAVALWRGEPFAGFDGYGAFRQVQGHLNELRLGAEGALAREWLDSGRSGDAIGRTATLVGEYPLDDSLIALHMEALYREGRHAEALEAYASYRSKLADTLGIEPSPDLASLELRILQHDLPRIGATIDRDTALPEPTPLPRRYSSFVGRGKEVARVVAASSESRLVTLLGPGGIGKSSVAIEAGRGSPGAGRRVAYVKLDPIGEGLASQAMVDALGLNLDSEARVTEILVTYLASHPHLLILDGCEPHTSELSPVVDAILSASDSALIATSRVPLALAGEVRLHIGGLPIADAISLFLDRSGVSAPTPSDSSAIESICRQLDGMPLAIELAAAKAASLPLDHIESRLSDQISILSRGPGREGRHDSVRGALQWSFEILAPHDQRVLLSLSMFDQSFPIGWALDLIGDPSTEDSVSHLVQSSLLEPPDDAAEYRMLEPIRQFARQHLTSTQRLDDVHMQYTTWLAHESKRQCRRFRFGRDDASYYRWLRRNRDTVPATVSWATDSGRLELALSLVASNGRFWDRAGDPEALGKVALQAVNAPAAKEQTSYGAALAHTGWLLRYSDPDSVDDLIQRIDQQIPTSDDPSTLQALYELAGHLRHARNEDALTGELLTHLNQLSDEYLRITEDLGEPLEPSYYNLALSAADNGDLDKAKSLVQAILADGAVVESSVRSAARTYRAVLFRGEGHIEQGITDAEASLKEAIETGSRHSTRWALITLARLHLDLNEVEASYDCLTQHDHIGQLLGFGQLRSHLPGLVAQINAARGQWDDFRDLMRLHLAKAPPPDQPEAREVWLAGDYTDPSGIGEHLRPVALWLAHHGRTDEAARVLASTQFAFTSSRNTNWDAVGETARVDALAKTFGTAGTDVPTTLDAIYQVLIDLIGSP